MRGDIFGIDLGTTNSCLAVMEGGTARALPIDGSPIVPSVVSFDPKSGDLVVGRRARNRALLEPAWTVRSIKRRMGATERIQVGDRELLPEEIAAEILRYLASEGARSAGRPVERVVIAVPAYFQDAQRRATIRAGELAGLEVVRLINEPTAAALVYDRLVHRGAEAPATPGGLHRVVVYDLGGGTFDVSVVELAAGIDEVRASCGDNHLGGDDFDARLVERLRGLLREKAGRLPEDLRLEARLLAAAEAAKIELSTRPFTRVLEEGILGRHHLDVELARHDFEELIADLLDGTLREVERALEEAKVTASEVERVILVGGSTHLPRVHELLARQFDCPIEHAVDPAECVALGAAIQGAILGGALFDHILVDVAPHTLGVQTADFVDDDLDEDGERGADYFSPIIRRNSQIPTRRAQVYCTLFDDQARVNVQVFQGEKRRCSENTLVGTFAYELEPAPAGAEIVVEFAYDTDGIIRITLEQRGTANRREVTLATRQGDKASEAGSTAADEVDNYILRKAASLAGTVSDSDLAARLLAATEAYRAVLATADADLEEVDRREDALLEALDEAEQAASGP